MIRLTNKYDRTKGTSI